MLFSRRHKINIFPAVIVYGTDTYYNENPLVLEQIANKLFENKANNFLRFKTNYFYNELLPKDLTEGRKVFVIVILISRAQLPLGYLTAEFFLLLPILYTQPCFYYKCKLLA